MDRETTYEALQRFCAERVGADLTAALMRRARPGLALTPAGGRPTGHDRFGGAPMLTPGTPWPYCDDYPMSLIAVIDTGHPWLDGVVPPGTGLLNFFHVDMHSEQAVFDPDELFDEYPVGSPKLGAVIAAPTATAVAVEAPEGARVLGVQEWHVTPGFSFPDDWDPDFRFPELDMDFLEILNLYSGKLEDLSEQPGVLTGGDVAFGRPHLPTGGSMNFEHGVDPTTFHHLLQLDGEHEFTIGGEGGVMHWSIPSDALAAGDFTRAIPTPDHF